MKNKKLLIVLFSLSLICQTAFGQSGAPGILGSGRIGASATSLQGLQDVDVSNPSDNDALLFNSTTGLWEDGATAGGGTGDSSNTELLWNNLGTVDGMSFFTTDGTDVTLDGILNIQNTAGNTGIVFGSLGTATTGIDMTSSGLSGSGDNWLDFDAQSSWRSDGMLFAKDITLVSGSTTTIGVGATTGQVNAGVNLLLRASSTDCIELREAGGLPSTAVNDLLLVGEYSNLGIWGGDGVSNGTTTITDVGGAAHGLSLAAGDLAYIRNATTSADEGLYRIVSDDGTSVVVDRALSGSDTNLDVIFYKDVIAFDKTDGTNGQRIMNYSHQDKPLQIGGDTLVATGHSLGSEDVLIGGQLEVGGIVFLGSTLLAADDAFIKLGNSSDAQLGWETADASANYLSIAMRGSTRNIIISADSNIDWGKDAVTDPVLYIQTADQTDVSKYISFTHNQTDGVITTGSGDLNLAPAGNVDLSDKNLNNVGSMTADSIVADDGTTVYIHNTADLQENNIDNVGSLSVDMVVADDGSTIYAGHNVDLQENNINNVGSVTLDTLVADDNSSIHIENDINMSNNIISNGEFKGMSETVVEVIANGATNLDYSQGNVFSIIMEEDSTFTITNPPTAGKMAYFTMDFTQGNLGTSVATFTNFIWADGTAPTLQTGVGSSSTVVGWGSSTTYRGALAGNNFFF